MNQNFAIGIVLYQPTRQIIERIKEVSKTEYKFIIFDNSNYINQEINNLQNIFYFHSSVNIGLSGGIDYIINIAIKQDYPTLLNFDQDTFFTINTLNFIKSVYTEYITKNKLPNNLIAIGFRDYTNPRKYTSEGNRINKNFFDVDFTINSGSLYLLDHYHKFVWFRRDFFVDGLDYYFCIQANKNGYCIMEHYETPDLNHTIEQGDSNLKIFKFIIKGRKYSLKRNFDFLKSHLKLLWLTIINLQPKHFSFIIKSLVFYLTTQILFNNKNRI